MNTALTGVVISPVNMENRKELGLKAGDTIKVHQKIQDKGKTRIQIFEGLVLARKHGNEPGATFTVRKVASGVGVEKIFPLYSPNIDKIEIVKRAKVRRAKLYYIRDKVAREIRRQMRRMHLVEMATESEAEAKVKAEAKAKESEEATKKAEEEAKKVEEATSAEAEVVTEANEDSAKDAEVTESEAEVKTEDAPVEEVEAEKGEEKTEDESTTKDDDNKTEEDTEDKK